MLEVNININLDLKLINKSLQNFSIKKKKISSQPARFIPHIVLNPSSPVYIMPFSISSIRSIETGVAAVAA